MPRKHRLNLKRYREQKRLYHDLRLEEKMRSVRAKRRACQPEEVSENEARLIKTLSAYRRRARFDALELELLNHERAAAGLPPLRQIPPDSPEMRALIQMEREVLEEFGL